MSLSAIAKTKRDGTILLKDGTGTPVTLTVQYEDGDWSVDGVSKHQSELVAFFDRGDFYTVRRGNQKFAQIKFTAHFTELSDATNGNLWDFINKTNKYNGNTSTLGSSAEVYTINILWTVEGTDHGDSSDHTLLVEDIACEMSIAEGEPNKFSITGTSYKRTLTAT